MAYFALLWKARTIEKYRLLYEKEKLNSIKISSNEATNKSFFNKWRNRNFDAKERLTKTFRKLSPEGSAINNFCFYLRTDQTFPNFVLKSVLGFVGGIVLTYLCFMFFVFQLSISLIHATIMSSIIGLMLTLGLAFSYRIRCLVFLLIPQFFSRVGRYTLTCYALVLILTGPATNTLKNSEVLSESMACAQEQIRTNVNVINESMKKPFNSMKGTIKLLVDNIRQIAVKLKDALVKFQRLVIIIAKILQSSFSWLDSVANTCNEKFGTPYELCTRSLNDAAADCHAKLGLKYYWVCNTAEVADLVCWTLKPLKSFCHAIDFVERNILKSVRRKLRTFSDRVKKMLFVQIHVHHSYSFSSNASRSASQVAAGIVTEIRNRADPLLTWLSWSSCVTSLFLLLIIFRAKYYQHMFETRSRFDNRYVTKELRDLDFKRLVQGRETVLPLNKREKGKYIQTTSFRLVGSEKVHLSRSAVFMVITTYKLMIHMIADYSLYWVLMTIRFHGRFQAPFQANPPDANIKISGSGFLTRFVRSLFNTLGIPLYHNPVSSPVLCLPDPHPPDLQRYGQIGQGTGLVTKNVLSFRKLLDKKCFESLILEKVPKVSKMMVSLEGILIILIWFFALFEPYGLRLRHIIMGLYRPERAKARAVWLYNHIQRTRAGFMKFARRKLHREYKYSTEEKYTFRQWLNSHLICKWLQYLLGTCPEEPHCLLCGTIEYPNDSCTILVRCETPSCPGTYCSRCFSDIGQLCTICLSPVDYGDLSDVSLEKGSSDESSDSDNDSGNNPGLARDLEAGGRSKTQLYVNEQLERKAKGRWNLFFQKKKGGRDEIPLLRRTDKVEDESHTNADHGKIVKKAMMIRHKRYCDIVSKQLTRSNETEFFCHYCKMHDISIKSKGKNATNGAFENKTRDPDNIGGTSSRNKQLKFKKTIGKPIQKAKPLEANLTTAILKKFRNLRKYSFEKKRQRMKIFKNKMLSTKITMDLKKRSPYQWKRKKKRKNSSKKRSRTSISLSWSRESTQSLSSNSLKQILSTRSLNLSRQSTNRVEKKVKNCSSKIEINSKIIRFLKSLRKRNPANLISGGDCANVSKHSEEAKHNISSHIITCSGDYNPTMTNIAKEKLDEIDDGTKEKGQEKKKEEIEVNITVERKKFRQRIGKLCRKYSGCWSTAKVRFSPSIKIVNYFKTDDAPLKCQKNNHKRRKKSESFEEVLKPIRPTLTTFTCKHQKDNEATRKYRLSSFLSEQEWRKRQKPLVKLQVTEALPIGQYDSELRTQEIKEKKPKIILKKAKQEMRLQEQKRLDNPKCDLTSNKKNPRKQANLGKGDPGNGSSVPSFGQLVTIVSSKTNDHSICDQCQGPELETRSPNYCLTRSWNYYRSLGHCDMDDPDYKLIDGTYKGNEDRRVVDTVKIPTVVRNKTPFQEPQKGASHSKLSPEDCSIIEVTFTDINDNCKARPHGYSDAAFKAKANLYKTRKPVLKKQLNKPKRFLKSVLLRLAETFQRVSNSMNVEDLPDQIDQSITAFPDVRTCACQYYNPIQSYEDRSTQILDKLNASQSVSLECIADVSVNAVKDYCSCATQFISLSKDVSTFYKNAARKPALKNTGVFTKLHQSIIKMKSVATMHKNCYKKMRNFATQSALTKNPSFAEAIKAKCASIMFPPYKEKKSKQNMKSPDNDENNPYSKSSEMRSVTEQQGFVNVNHSMDEKLHNDKSHFASKHSPIVQKKLIDRDSYSSDPCMKCIEHHKGSSLAIKIRDNSISSSISETLSSIRSEEETKTDTTICSLATVDYVDEKPRNKHRFKVSFIKKANQSTITDRKKFCDVSTVTSDWWSPIMERRNKNIVLEKKEGGYMMLTRNVRRRGDRRSKKNRGVSTDGRMVTFKSHAQIIPTVIDDILSPSRYLLESQKYYNELFSSKFYAPHVLPVNEIQKGEQEMNFSPKSYHETRRGHRTKRLEKNLTPRKLSSPRRLNVAQLAHIWKVETANQMRQPKHRSGVKTTKNMKKSYDKSAYSLKKAKRNLLPRGFVSHDHISMDCHCNSTGTVGSY